MATQTNLFDDNGWRYFWGKISATITSAVNSLMPTINGIRTQLTNHVAKVATDSEAGHVVVDTAVSDASANPVQNKAVANAISAVQSSISDLEGCVSGLAAAVIFKGTIGTGGTVTALPGSCQKGWEYIVLTAGSYAGKVCEPGDMLICIKSGNFAIGSDAYNNAWNAVQANVVWLSDTEWNDWLTNTLGV